MSGSDNETSVQPRDPARTLLERTIAIVTGPRRAAYGTPEDNFATIAELWTTYCRRRGLTTPAQFPGSTFSPEDVAHMMVLMKVARLAETPDHIDSLIDIAGYAACSHRCSTKTPGTV